MAYEEAREGFKKLLSNQINILRNARLFLLRNHQTPKSLQLSFQEVLPPEMESDGDTNQPDSKKTPNDT